jgi:hypothetical protein
LPLHRRGCRHGMVGKIFFQSYSQTSSFFFPGDQRWLGEGTHESSVSLFKQRDPIKSSQGKISINR